ncbi:Inner membrane protein YcfT [Hartmannibacter diazotrophicus]|uniref:Inner membrane protein YcfT n=1 Tax=Hartmannibacter diazotrophicus TaxID=1482074 RepID=A0A2C9DEB1_9HYPH|nr:acyltransferase family protein [Hartmannibacter diazotrophicus]SON58291.1 Inner membrane protein YcfT [Hartmannibacter diazotrophicus]
MPALHKSRVDWVDYAKGICIIFVVMMHSVEGVERLSGGAGWLGTVVEFARPFRMPDFFLISGLFLSRVIDRPANVFYDRRFLHFFYFYIIWLTIQFAFRGPGMVAEVGVDGTLLNYAAAILYQPFGTLWFIWMLPVFAVAVRLTRRVNPLIIWSIAAVLEMSHLSFGMETPDDLGWYAVNQFGWRFVYFYTGYIAAPYIFMIASRIAERPMHAMAVLPLWGFVNAVLVFGGYSLLPGVSLALGLAGAGAIITVAVLCTEAARRLSAFDLLRFCGQNSIVIYLSFFLPMAVSRFILLKYAGGHLDVGTVSALVTLAGVAGSFAMWFIAMRTGFSFLYVRPQWARIERREPRRADGSAPAFQPAE